MANIITTLALEMNANWYVSKKLNSVGRVGENTVTKLTIEPTEILDATYEIEIMSANGSKNVAELTIDGTELYLILTANMLTTNGITKMQVRAVFEDGSIKKSNIFELKVNRSISATDYYEEYAVTIFDQLVTECRDIIEGAESYAVRAETAAVNAEAYSESASASADTASAAATTASTASATAVNAAASAESASTSAHTSAETASTAAASASTAASTATSASETAQAASVTASTSAETAVNASIVATTAQTSAETAANSASTSANNASASATAASTSAANAATSETNASTSAANASTSETNAASSATSAANSATSANTSATNAANSATAAATSATNAHTSEVNASTSETNAEASATEAADTAASIAASVAQINENTYRINDLEAIIGGYQLTDLPTGEIASITDGTALLMPGLKVGIEPVQDLHGYDHPWAGGAGKNKCNAQNPIVLSRADNIGNQPCAISAGTYIYSWTSSENTAISLTLWNDSTQIGSFASTTAIQGRGNITFTITENATHLRCYYNGATTISDIQVESGSTATSYEPYSNICPISGWTAANVTRNGKNICPNTYNIGMYDANGVYVNSNNYRSTDKFAVIPNTQYTSSLLNSANTRISSLVAVEFDKNKNPLKIQNATSSFTTSPNTYYISLRNFDANISDVQSENFHYQLELGTTATTYEPYNGTTYNVQFADGDNPLTVYGGTLDVTTGELVVDRKLLLINGDSNVSVGAYKMPFRISIPNDAKAFTSVALWGSKCNMMTEVVQESSWGIPATYSFAGNLKQIYFKLTNDLTDVNELKAFLTENPIEICYFIDTPTTYHLTPTQVRTLVGTNNIWADTGDIIEGKYYRSPF